MAVTPRSRLRVAGHDLAIGVVLALGQAPFGLWPLSLAALALGLRRIVAAPDAGAALRRAWLIGAGYFGLSLSWIVQPFFVDPWRHAWMAPFAFLGVAFGLGLFWALAAWTARRLGGGVLLLALAMAAAELLRGHLLTGFPWALLGHIWADTPVAQLASLVGSYGMTALTLLVVALPLCQTRPGAKVWHRYAGPALSAAIAVAALGWSYHRLSLAEPPPRAGIVRLVQPNIAQSLKWDPDQARLNFDRLLGLSKGSGADLVIWPETAVPYLIEEGEGVALAMATAAAPAMLATGLQRDQGRLAWNSLAVVAPGGVISQSFDKIHLVPFGEYIPMGDLAFRWFGLRAFASQVGAGYTAGTERNLLQFGRDLGRALPVICYEAIFPEELSSAERADWILQATNDAWFGTLTGPYQHFDQTRLRAIEQGLPLLRAANTGITAFIDARGRVVQGPQGPLLLALGEMGVLDGQVPGALPPPPYARSVARFGDWPLAALLALAIGSLTIAARRGAKHFVNAA